MIDQSRPVLHPPGTLVKFVFKGAGRVYVVDHNSGTDSCWIWNRLYTSPYAAPENDLRRLTFWEFLWYKDPTTGGMKIGKNRALPILLWLAIMLACSVASMVGTEGFWRWFWPGMTVLSVIGVLLATRANHRDRQA